MSNKKQIEYHSIREKQTLSKSLQKLSGKAHIFFGRATEDYCNSDHGCIVSSSDNGLFEYILEGHGIGSNKKPSASIDDTVRRIFADCQRFRGGDIVTLMIG